MSGSDTISAIATPPGAGGIAIVRLSGPGSRGILQRVFVPRSSGFTEFRPWTLHRGQALDAAGDPLDDVLAVFMPGPRTFTGEDTAELHCHGGPVIVQTLLEATLAAGARLAERGEFSRRAFCNGRMDLTQAEAIAEMVAAPSREAVRLAVNKLDGVLGRRIHKMRMQLEQLRMRVCAAVDFPEEEAECLAPEVFIQEVHAVAGAAQQLLASYRRGRCVRQGALVVLTGAANAGKSSLMNALLGRNRALVTEIPGTTRDFLEESLLLETLPVRLVDTAGLRETQDQVERLGVERSREMLEQADLILLVVDAQCGLDAAGNALLAGDAASHVLVVWNKCDIAGVAAAPACCRERSAGCVEISARTGQGLEMLAAAIRRTLTALHGETSPDMLAPNARQAAALERALQELAALEQDIRAGLPCDVCAVRLDGAAAALGEVCGLDTPEAVLNRVFESFCMGK